MQDISDGKHIGRVVDVAYTTSKKGNWMIKINWDLGNAKVYSFHVIQDAAGNRNERNIDTLRKVFPLWDGSNAEWFEDNYDTLMGTKAELVIGHNEWQGISCPSVLYVNAICGNGWGVPTRKPAEPAKPLGLLPDKIEPTPTGVWEAFVNLHANESYEELEKGWFALLDRTIVPQKDQDLYTELDWRNVIAAMKEVA